MKTTLCATLLALSLASPALAADISTYTVGSMKIVRIVDSADGVPVKFMFGDKDVISELVPTGMCPNSISSYVIETKEDLYLIDSGFGDIKPGAMYRNFLNVGYNPDEVKLVLMTHLHGDHLGGLTKDGKKVFKNAQIYVKDTELAFWKNRDNTPSVPESQRFCFDEAEKLLRVYGNQVKTFREGEKVVPWLTPISVPGHTAGHTMFELNWEGEKRYIWGDIIHCLDVQAKHPEVTVIWDNDRDMARASRMKALELVADTDVPVFGEHLKSPGVAKFYRDPKGGYRYDLIEPEASAK